MLRLLVICNWTLILMILALADRDAGLDSGGLGFMTLLKAGIRLGILGILATLAFCKWSDDRRGEVIQRMLPWVCFGIWSVMTSAWSPLWTFSLGQSLTLVMLLLLAFCTAMLAHRYEDASTLLKHLSLAFLAVSIVLLTLRIAAPSTLSLVRGSKGLLHPTNASSTASLALIIAIWARFSFGWAWSRWLLWPAIAIHGATLALANNRMSLAATLLVVIAMLLVQIYGSWRWVGLTAISAVCAAYVTVDPGFLFLTRTGGGVVSYLSRDQSGWQLAALSGREEMWTAMWESFWRSPWIGHGYLVSSATGEVYVWLLWANWTAHNFWMQTLVSTGVIGATLLVWAFISYVRQMLHARTDGAGLKRFALLGAGVLVWQAIWGLANESFVGPLQPESVIYFTVLGLLIGRAVCSVQDVQRLDAWLRPSMRSQPVVSPLGAPASLSLRRS